LPKGEQGLPKRFSIIFLACAACLWSQWVWAGNFEAVTYQNILFVQLPAGSFTMGTSDSEQAMLEGQKNWTRFEKGERPRRVVTLTKPFLIGKYEVTQKQWRQVTGKNPSAFKGTNSLPVESVSWEDVQEFIKKLNEQGDGKFRLPTEAEWEYACRAGSTNFYSLNRSAEEVDLVTVGDYAWYRSNSENKTHPIGAKKPNAWGLHDMHGNVWEWCQDWFDGQFYGHAPPKDPINKQPGVERVIRGGSWFLEAHTLRAAYRSGNLPTFKSQYAGFRLARDL
jgi:formylglycine-generating enzyme required for sulfatase activity